MRLPAKFLYLSIPAVLLLLVAVVALGGLFGNLILPVKVLQFSDIPPLFVPVIVFYLMILIGDRWAHRSVMNHNKKIDELATSPS